ncbi:MAG: hypothetical protein RLZZ387_1783 [Chloroflexota bacterium]|jgi:xylitol oxidase
MPDNARNWAGNLAYSAARLHTPETVDEVRAIVRGSHKARALGSRHSFNQVADTPGDLIALDRLGRVVALDRERGTVTVEGGMRYGQLGAYLHAEGYALHNMASLPHISVAGAVATATHGSGDGNGNLATAVAAMELVTADGEVVALSREEHGDLFRGAVVGLGALGVVTKLTLDIEPTFDVAQEMYLRLPLGELYRHFDAIMAAAYSVSLFTDWHPEHVGRVWLKRRVAPGEALEWPQTFYGALRASEGEGPAENWTEAGGIPGPWHERLPHFRMGFTPSSGDELQSEYFVPREHAVAALRGVGELREQVRPHLMASEVRSVAGDALWLSPGYRGAYIGLHFTWKQDWDGVQRVLPRIEEVLEPLGAVPHWGKLFTMAPQRLRAGFERMGDFQALLRSFDPRGVFRNPFLETYIFGEDQPAPPVSLPQTRRSATLRLRTRT